MLRRILTMLKKCIIAPSHQIIQATLEREIDEKTEVEYISSTSVNKYRGKEKINNFRVFRRKSSMP